MSVAGISSTSLTPAPVQTPSSGRTQKDDAWRQLEQALQSGDQATAQQAYNTLAGPNNSGPFSSPTRTAEFQKLGQSIQAGDLTGAQQEATQLGNQQLATDSKIYENDVQSGSPAAQRALADLRGDTWAVTGQALVNPAGPQGAITTPDVSPSAPAINVQA